MRTQLEKHMLWAAIVPVGMMLAGIFLRPYWRDEFWSLFLTDPARSFSLAAMHFDTSHPPFYNTILRGWRALESSDLWARLLSLPVLAAGAAGVIALWRGRPELKLFLLICAGSYWVIYFAAQTRPYVLMFVLCTLSVFVAARALERNANTLLWALVWFVLCIFLDLSHYFAALWGACLGLAVGLTLLRRGDVAGFLAWGFASTLALAPVAYWLLKSYDMNALARVSAPDTSDGAGIWAGLQQLLRGLVVKTAGSNIAIAAAAIVGAAAFWRKREPIDYALAFAVLLLILMTFIVQATWTPIIKERAFIVIMPAILFLATRAILALSEGGLWSTRFVKAAPAIAVLSPFAFIPEYFKDVERLDEAKAFVRSTAGDCSGAPIVAYYRGGPREHEMQTWIATRFLADVVAAGKPPPKLVNAEEEGAQPVGAVASCKIKAIALMLPRKERIWQQRAREALKRAGVPLDQLSEHRFGGSRQLIFVEGAK